MPTSSFALLTLLLVVVAACDGGAPAVHGKPAGPPAGTAFAPAGGKLAPHLATSQGPPAGEPSPVDGLFAPRPSVHLDRVVWPAPALADPGCERCHEKSRADAIHGKLFARHPSLGAGCVVCHGGDASATEAGPAHGEAIGPPGTPPLWTALLRGAAAKAACAHCHVPGSVEGTEPHARGALLALELGCPSCHMTGALSRQVVGLPLETVGYRGEAYVRQMVRDAAVLVPGTKMPAFQERFAGKSDEDAIVAWVLALRGPSRRAAGGEGKLCASCHGVDPKAGWPKVGTTGPAPHGCGYLQARRDELACARCHEAPIATGVACPFVNLHRPACGACHAAP